MSEFSDVLYEPISTPPKPAPFADLETEGDSTKAKSVPSATDDEDDHLSGVTDELVNPQLKDYSIPLVAQTVDLENDCT